MVVFQYSLLVLKIEICLSVAELRVSFHRARHASRRPSRYDATRDKLQNSVVLMALAD